MRHRALSVLALCLLAALVTLVPRAALAEQPPIIDRNLFFGEIEISGAQISPDGQFVSFLKPYRGVRNLWVKRATEPFSAARPVSAESSRPVEHYFWSRDSKYLLYLQDAGGDENFNFHAIDPRAPAEPSSGVPPGRALTAFKGVHMELYAAPKAKPDILYIGLNDRDKRWHDLYELHISSGARRLLRQNNAQIGSWSFDHDGNLRLALRTTPAGDTEVLRTDPDGFKTLYSCSVLETCGIADFEASTRNAYLYTNKGKTDFIELELLDLGNGATSKVDSDSERRADLSSITLSEGDHRLLFTTYDDGKPRRQFQDRSFEKDFNALKKQLPGKEITLGTRSSDENLWMLTASSDTDPGSAYLWNRKARSLKLQYRLRDELPREALAPRKAYSYKSSGGLVIHGYLTLPKGLPARKLPLIVWPHGVPWAHERDGYDPYAQFFANRGYAVLQPNFRGSSGSGKRFLNAGNGEWGRLMQEDLSFGVKALVKEGIADPKRTGIGGGFYGGYAALAGVAFTPKLYAAAVALDAPSSLTTWLDGLPPYWESGRRQLYMRLADPASAEGHATLASESPLNQAKAIITPLLVVQGQNDPRVNLRESNQIVAAMRDNGRPVKYLTAPDEGHDFARPINHLALAAAMESFYAQHLGGRAQTEVPPEVAARLSEMSVDPATVSANPLFSLKADPPPQEP